MKIAIVGGTGQIGLGLALRWTMVGHEVLIGSRTPEKAEKAAAEVKEKTGVDRAKGMGIVDAVKSAEVVVIAVPMSAHVTALEAIKDAAQGKIVIDVCNPLNPKNPNEVLPPPAGSAAQEAQEILGEKTRVLCAFNSTSFKLLQNLDEKIAGETLVCGGSEDDRKLVLGLAKDAGVQAWDVGPITQAHNVECVTALLVGLNIKHHSRIAGMRITDLDPD